RLLGPARHGRSNAAALCPHATNRRARRDAFRRHPHDRHIRFNSRFCGCALALRLAASLVLKGLALQPRSFASRLTLGGVALALAITAFVVAGGWFERAVLAGFAFVFSPLLLGVAVIREDHVGVVIKKFAAQSL